ncbi:hypothetical protein OQA88_8537 [Cercophora sp. LCS_1]
MSLTKLPIHLFNRQSTIEITDGRIANDSNTSTYSLPILAWVAIGIAALVFACIVSVTVTCIVKKKKRKLREVQAQLAGVGNYHYIHGPGGGLVAVPYSGAPQRAPVPAGEVTPMVDLRPLQGYYAPPAPAPNPEVAAARRSQPPLEGYFAPAGVAAPAPAVVSGGRS